MKHFKDRSDAGRQLAAALITREFPNPVVLALPRGGVPVAVEVAEALKAPLDLVMVRKLGVPSQPELAAGAVVNGEQPEIVVNEDIATHFGLTAKDMQALADVELQEIRRRRTLYLANRLPVALTGRTAIVIDDGIATGATMLAALRAIRRRAPALLVMAVPVAPRDSLMRLGDSADEVVCLETPDPFFAVGVHYDDFPQVPDEEVIRLMKTSQMSSPLADRTAGHAAPEA
jgi:putative phosphoribosyl transferase